MDVNVLRRNRATWIGEMKALHDGAEGRDLTEDEQRQFDGLRAKVESVDKQIKRAEEVEALAASTASERAQPVGGQIEAPMLNQKTKRGDTAEKAFAYYVRTADASAINAERRASNDTGMNVTTAADGGYAVPTGHFNQIIARRDEQMLAPKLGVRMIVGKGTTVNVPLDAEDDGEFVTKGEMGDDNTTNAFDRDAPAMGNAAMTLVKYTKKIELTDEILEDEDSNLLAFIEDFVGRGMAKTHNSLLTTAALAGGTAALTLDSASAIAYTEIPELWYLLPDAYATDEPSVAWLMRRATEGAIRGLAGTTNFYYSPTPGGTTTIMRPTLWGAPLYNTGYMPAIAASAKTLVLGNWYFMGRRDGPSISVLRDPYTVDGKVILKYYYRTVYKVLQAEAIVYATHPTA